MGRWQVKVKKGWNGGDGYLFFKTERRGGEGREIGLIYNSFLLALCILYHLSISPSFPRYVHCIKGLVSAPCPAPCLLSPHPGALV